MGQARRKKLAKLSETDRGRKLWDASVIKKFLPEGHRPIATRYSPIDGCLHVACDDGSLHKISWQDAERAERELYIPTSTERGGKAGQGQRTECPPTGSDGEAGEAGETESDDKLSADEAWEKVEAQRERDENEACTCGATDEDEDEDDEPCPVHGEDGEGKPDNKKPDDWTQRWDMAGARYDEWLANGDHSEHAMPHKPTECECMGTIYADESRHQHTGDNNCTKNAGRKMAGGGFFAQSPGFLCDECAIFCVARLGVKALDSDPEK